MPVKITSEELKLEQEQKPAKKQQSKLSKLISL